MMMAMDFSRSLEVSEGSGAILQGKQRKIKGLEHGASVCLNQVMVHAREANFNWRMPLVGVGELPQEDPRAMDS